MRMIEKGEEIPFYGDGTSQRDYTYIDDIIDGIIGALTHQNHAFEIFNLGNSNPVPLHYLIHLIEKSSGKKAKLKKLPMQPGDVPITYADIGKAEKHFGYSPKVSIEEGVALFVRWYHQSVPSLSKTLA